MENLTVILYVFKIYLKIVYFFIKLFTKQEQQVFFLSRQYSKVSLNYRWIIHELKKNNKKIKIKVICQKVDSEINETLRDKQKYSNIFVIITKFMKQLSGAWDYYINLHKQMYYISK